MHRLWTGAAAGLGILLVVISGCGPGVAADGRQTRPATRAPERRPPPEAPPRRPPTRPPPRSAPPEVRRAPTASPPPAAHAAPQVRKTMVVLVHFRNTPVPKKPPADFATMLEAVDDFYRETSYGKFAIRGARQPSRAADVFGWHRIAMDRACRIQEVRSRALDAVRARDGVDPDDYQEFVFVAEFPEGCLYRGTANAGQAAAWIDLPWSSVYLFAHEIGHSLGFGHANALDCDDGPFDTSACRVVEYGDAFDIMGRTPIGHLNAPHMDQIGWFEPSNVVEVTRDGTFVLEPIETATTGLKAIRIPRAAGDALYVEYRQPIGFDVQKDFADAYRGALLHTLGRKGNRTLLIDATPRTNRWSPALHVGKTFTDPATGSQVTVLSATSGANAKLTVRVRVGTPFEPNPPTARLTRPAAKSRISGATSLSATAGDDSGVASVAFFATDPTGIEVPLGVDETVDAQGAYSVTVDSRAALSNGTAQLYARATDIHGNVGEAGASIAVEVRNGGDSTPPEVSISFPFEGTLPVRVQVVQGLARDPGSGIARLDVFMNHDTKRPVATISDVTGGKFWIELEQPLTAGSWTVMVRAVDRQGNVTDTPWRSFRLTGGANVDAPTRRPSNSPPSR